MLPKININALRIGWYSDKYFIRTQEILIKDNFDSKVHYQYFPRKDCVICGIPHVEQIFRKCTGYYANRELAWKLFSEMQEINVYDCSEEDLFKFHELNTKLNELWVSKFDEIEMFTIEEGVNVKDMEVVIGIIGNPKYFAHLETPTLGVLAQQSAVATSVRTANEKLNPGQSLLFFPARFRHYASQAPDGYACSVGGVQTMSTDSNGEYWGYNGIGTIPHLLIAAYGGRTHLAAKKFDEYIDKDVNRIILVDWDNDCINTTIECVAYFLYRRLKLREQPVIESIDELQKIEKPYDFLRNYKHCISEVIGSGKGKIYGVRFDTSGSLTDYSLPLAPGLSGVCPLLVDVARDTFDELGLNDLKIIVSGGFDNQKIDLFQKATHDGKTGIPFDMIGIGSSIVNKFTVDFTADAVMLNNLPNAKIGRELMDWSKLKQIK